jgi:hypothetical protein
MNHNSAIAADLFYNYVLRFFFAKHRDLSEEVMFFTKLRNYLLFFNEVRKFVDSSPPHPSPAPKKLSSCCNKFRKFVKCIRV